MLYSPAFDAIPSNPHLNGLDRPTVIGRSSRRDRLLHGSARTQSMDAHHANKRTAPQPSSGITEVILPKGDDLSIVLPSLAYLTHHHQDRWLTWISLKPRVDRNLLQDYEFDLSHVRVVYPKSQEEAFWLFWEALTEGNSHTVIGTLGNLESQALKKLQRAAAAGRCMGMVLRTRNADA